MVSKNKTLKEAFLSENALSHHYGLDKDTPRNVYVPDTTQNRVIAYTGEEPIDEISDRPDEPVDPEEAEEIALVQQQLDRAFGAPDKEIEIDWGDIDNPKAKSHMHTEHCGCEPAEPELHRVGAPGGPDLGGSLDDNDPRHVLFDTEVDYYDEGSVYGTGGPSKEGSVILADQELGGHQAIDAARWDLEHNKDEKEDEERAVAAEDEAASKYEKHTSDYKPKVSEAFGDVIGDDWLEIG